MLLCNIRGNLSAKMTTICCIFLTLFQFRTVFETFAELLLAHIISSGNKKMVDHFCLIRKILPSSNGCRLVKNGYLFVNLRKYLCFYLEKNFLLKQKDFFSGTNAKCPKKDTNLRLWQIMPWNNDFHSNKCG